MRLTTLSGGLSPYVLVTMFLGTYGCTAEAPGGPASEGGGSSSSGSTTATLATPELTDGTSGAPTTTLETSGGPAMSSSGSTTAVGPYCGDGVTDPPEECDEGPNNADDGACTHQCTAAICGDGHVWAGFEACDLGAGNSSEYGGCDGCQWGSHCGDGIVDEGHEVCDLGELNGTGVAEDEGMGPCKATCSWQGRLVFLTSVGYTGALGGVDGADIRCRDRAKAAGFANASSFRAWLSDAAQSPATRFEQQALSEAPYILRNGRVVAEDFSELLDEGPRTGISIDETGAMVTETLVWTNTSGLGGTLHPVNHCDSWTSTSAEHVAMTGLNALAVEAGPSWETWRAERRWTVLQSFRCEFAQRLYCFEDGYAPED